MNRDEEKDGGWVINLVSEEELGEGQVTEDMIGTVSEGSWR